MKNSLLILALFFLSNFSLSFSIKEFMDMEESGYTEEMEIFFTGLVQGAFVMNGMVFEEYGEIMLCAPNEMDGRYYLDNTLNYLKKFGPNVATHWEKETGRKDFYQEHVSMGFGLMMAGYDCDIDSNKENKKVLDDFIKKNK